MCQLYNDPSYEQLLFWYTKHFGSLVPRPMPQLLSLAVRKTVIFSTVRKKSCRVEPGNEANILV